MMEVRTSPPILSNHSLIALSILTPVQNTITPEFKLLAYALILLRQEGRPCLFYGDLYGIWDAQTQQAHRDAAYAYQLPILTRTRKLFAYGEQQDYFDQAHCIGTFPPTYHHRIN